LGVSNFQFISLRNQAEAFSIGKIDFFAI
jgi:hypothetical protein